MLVDVTPAQIAKATGSKEEDVKKVLPELIVAMNEAKINTTNPLIVAGVLATVAVECHFKSITEHGAVAYFKRYEGRKDLGNTLPGDGYRYRGRGLIQLTGRFNYEKFGKLLNIDLLNNPDFALDVRIASKVMAHYLKLHGVDVWSSRGHWLKVRKLVNGGTNGFTVFQQYVWNLLELFYK